MTCMVGEPRVQLHPAAHVYPNIAVELLGRVAVAFEGSAWHVATALFGEDLLVVGLDSDTLRRGLAAERATWQTAARQAFGRFALDERRNGDAVDAFADAALRAEQADLLLAAVRDSAQLDCRDQARQDAPGCGVPPATSGASDAPEAPGHDLSAGGVVQA